MESFLRERQILFRTALSRKLFFHRFQKFGIDEVDFTEAESNVNDLVWEYGSINFAGNMGVNSLFDDENEEADQSDDNSNIEYNEDIGDLTSNDEIPDNNE